MLKEFKTPEFDYIVYVHSHLLLIYYQIFILLSLLLENNVLSSFDNNIIRTESL